MRRRHRSGSRMMIRGKPGLIILVVLLLVGTLVAYYTWAGSSSSSASKTRYSKYGHKSQYPAQSHLNMGLRYGGQQMQKGPQMQNPPEKPLEPARNFDFQDGPKPDIDEDYRFNADGDDDNDEEIEKSREDFREKDEDFRSDLKTKDDLKEQKFQQSDEKPSSGILYPQLYVAPDPKVSERFRQMEHIVHLDLKGAPPKVDYIISLIPLMKKLGATGLLVEYEDMFPYNGELFSLASSHAYKTQDIIRLLNAAKNSGLKVIPLIQTFGHMEFVLKYSKYLDLRESPDTPQVITPTSLKSYDLIQKMIDQVMTVHSNAPYLHIGCDEVYGLGQGKVKDMMKAENLTTAQVFLNHVKKVASYVRNKYSKTKVIMWDDELRSKVSNKDIEKSGLGDLVELMVWSYLPHPKERLPENIWIKYAKYFSGLWAASSFKGATGSAQFFTNVSYHLENHINWIQIVKDLKDVVPAEKFRGFALTGWQRYDHFATLCELLPSSIPSLAVNLQVVQNGGFSPDIHKTVSRLLNCTKPVELDFPKKDGKEFVISQDCRFPGYEFYYAVQMLWGTMDKFHSDAGLQSRIEGWLTDYHIKTHFSSPAHMKILQKKLIKIVDKLKSLVSPVRNYLKVIYDDDTVEEWIMVHLTQKIDELRKKLNMATELLQNKTWDKRPVVPGPSSSPMQQQPQLGQQPQRQLGQQQQQQQQQPQLGQQQLQQQNYGQRMNNVFKPAGNFIQSNNQLPPNTFGLQKNQQTYPINQGQLQRQTGQGVQNSLLQSQGLGQQSKLGMFNQQNSIGQQGGFGQKSFGAPNTGIQSGTNSRFQAGINNGVQTGTGGRVQSNYNLNVPQGQMSAQLQQFKPFGGLGAQMNKIMNPSKNMDISVFGTRQTDKKSEGFVPGKQNNALGAEKKTDGAVIERSKSFPDKLKDGLVQGFDSKKTEPKEKGLQGMDGTKTKLDSKFDSPGHGVGKGDFKDLDDSKKGLQKRDEEYEEADDKEEQR